MLLSWCLFQNLPTNIICPYDSRGKAYPCTLMIFKIQLVSHGHLLGNVTYNGQWP